jgi:hypothetical protein
MVAISAPKAYAVVSLRNGAIRRNVLDAGGKWKDGSIVALTSGNSSTQLCQVQEIEQYEAFIRYGLEPAERCQALNTAFRSSLLRFLGWLLYRCPPGQRLLKRALARFVMKRRGRGSPGRLRITVNLQDPELPVETVQEHGTWTPRSFGFHRHTASANTFDPRAL